MKKNKTTWDAMRETADAAELRELNEIALKSLKEKQMFNKTTPPEERKNLMRNNIQVRKEAKKILKDDAELSKFMAAPSWDHYKPTFEGALNNVIKSVPPTAAANVKQFGQAIADAREKGQLENINKGRTGLNTIVYYNAEDAAKPRPPKKITPTEDFKTPESEFMRVPEFLEKHYKPEPDPDLVKGIGSLNLKDLKND